MKALIAYDGSECAKAAIQDDTVSIVEIFVSSIPYWVIMLTAVVVIAYVPQIATYLPALLF